MKSLKFPIIGAIPFLFFAVGCSSDASKVENKVDANPKLADIEVHELENGLKVFMSVNKDEPRIFTSIAVRAGSKYDPADATGLAHYLEHMLFKGTSELGSLDYGKEKIHLEQIDSLYEIYGATTDEAERKSIYSEIDSISNLAARYTVPNEYDKLVNLMGATGTNAYTSNEQTVYINDIPANQLKNWLDLEYDRFTDPVMRLFHTELETVYEEKNRTLDNDYRKAYAATMDLLYPNHQYGQQTTIGTIEHLKNPSLKKMKKYFDDYYVPNNMAICITGDFEPDSALHWIKNTFGKMQSKAIPEYQKIEEKPIAQTVDTTVLGPNAEFLRMAWRIPAYGSEEALKARLLSNILYNGTAGLIDLNINNAQKALSAYAYSSANKDYTTFTMGGTPREGQSLEDLQNLLLAQLDSVKQGHFPDWLIEASINEEKLLRIENMDDRNSMNRYLVSSFVFDVKPEEYLDDIEEMESISKDDLMQFAKNTFGNNAVVVYKQTGEDTSIAKIEKPHITPIDINRDTASAYFAEMSAREVNPIEPVFVDYNKEIAQFELFDKIPVRMVKNESNELFTLFYLVEMGSNNDNKIIAAIDYLPYLGTDSLSNSEINQAFYRMGCSFDVFSGEEQIYVYLTGLTENFDEGVKLFEHLLKNAKVDAEALANLKKDKIKKREDGMKDKFMLSYYMREFATYGGNSPLMNVLSNEELISIEAEELVERIHKLTSYPHKIIYYGPMDQNALATSLEKNHSVPNEFISIPESKKFVELENEGNELFVVNHDMQQAEIILISKDQNLNAKELAIAKLYNEYFGTGMNSILFQEMREARGLAYSVYSAYRTPADTNKSHQVYAYIGSQADKLTEALGGMLEMLNEMPESVKSFETAKKGAMEKLRTDRIIKSSKLWNYESALKKGFDHDIRKDIYQQIPSLTMEDLKNFYNNRISGSNYRIMIIGDTNKLDLAALEAYGKVKVMEKNDLVPFYKEEKSKAL